MSAATIEREPYAAAHAYGTTIELARITTRGVLLRVDSLGVVSALDYRAPWHNGLCRSAPIASADGLTISGVFPLDRVTARAYLAREAVRLVALVVAANTAALCESHARVARTPDRVRVVATGCERCEVEA